ncbi:DgyrCDS13750 [Dimorphilus gyrociliatus]|uniref:DgyrCDS13750 n=1 Tax=Dimorphilus gyrociliatus TaxID=2664684 RepID=A0A7I8WBR1_9ANNE|nr:DgyrCDS13750 [Dimorphilus gyrociliatus]
MYKDFLTSYWIYILLFQFCIKYSKAEDRRLCQLENQIKPIELHLKENIAKGAKVIKLNIIGEHGSDITTSMDYNDHLSYNQTSKVITTKKDLDAEKLKTIAVTVICKTLSVGNVMNTILVLITIDDENDNPPNIILPPQPVVVDEILPLNSTVAQIRVEDVDSVSPKIRLSILPSKYSDYFEIPTSYITTNSRTILALKKPLDYEKTSRMIITIVAEDNGKPSRNSSRDIELHIRDNDDQSPIFSKQMYKIRLPDQFSIGFKVQPEEGKIFAYDPDKSFNATIIYELVPDPLFSETIDLFQIDSKTGSIKLLKNSQMILQQINFCMGIKAIQADNSHRYSTSLLRIGTYNLDNKNPIFPQSNYTKEVYENFEIGQSIIKISAYHYQQRLIKYRFTTNNELFSINEQTGVVSTKSALDYEKDIFHSFIVEAYINSYVSTTTVSIKVLNINEFAPNFNNGVFSVISEKTYEQMIIALEANDGDGDSLSFSLLYYDNLFSIKRLLNNKIELFIKVKPEELGENQYVLPITVTDDGSPNRSNTTIVYVDFKKSVQLPITRAESNVKTAIIILLSCLSGVLVLVIAVLILSMCRRKDGLESIKNKIDAYHGVTFDDISATQPAESPFKIDNNVNELNQVSQISHVVLHYDDQRHLTSSTDSLPNTEMYSRRSIVNSKSDDTDSIFDSVDVLFARFFPFSRGGNGGGLCRVEFFGRG